MALTLDDILASKITAESDNIRRQFILGLRNLYRLPLLVPTANLILSIAKEGRATFIISVKRQYDTLRGICQTTSGGFFSKLFGGKPSGRNFQYKIGIKVPRADVITHEVTHALEHESGVDLNAEFRKAIGEDMRDKRAEQFGIRQAVDSIMKMGLLSYEQSHIMSELQARYFQLLATSREMGNFNEYPFNYSEIQAFFANTTRWLTETYNPLLSSMADPEVVQLGQELQETVTQENVNRFADQKITSMHGGPERAEGVGKWTKTFGSTMDAYNNFAKVGMLEGQTAINNQQADRLALEDKDNNNKS